MLLGGTNLVGGYFYHGVEGVRTFAGSTCTLSYYYNNVSGTETGTTPYIRQTFGIGGSGDIDTYPISDTATLVGGALFRRTLVYNLPSVAGKAIGANNHLRIIVPASGTFQKAYWSFQFEGGSVATPFEVKPHGIELAQCQRYYWKEELSGSFFQDAYQNILQTYAVNNITFPTTMRATPTMSFSGAAFATTNLFSNQVIATSPSMYSWRLRCSAVGRFFAQAPASGAFIIADGVEL
jgi:hypothetical protein